MQSQNELQNLLKNLENDQILKILLENSHITKTQLETVLIEILSTNYQEKRIKVEEKAKMRLKGKVSRGAFNRTLKQAKTNIIKSIFTIFLLGYLKIADSSTLLLQAIEISNKLREYTEEQDPDTLRKIQNKLTEIISEYLLMKGL
ncbi:MAG: hypothetical protein N3E48_00045 [Candidatus Bathyarchaeota archaeon]|nr:hypothetical protein [Candidatus Bathyarchaeota archaeon]